MSARSTTVDWYFHAHDVTKLLHTTSGYINPYFGKSSRNRVRVFGRSRSLNAFRAPPCWSWRDRTSIQDQWTVYVRVFRGVLALRTTTEFGRRDGRSGVRCFGATSWEFEVSINLGRELCYPLNKLKFIRIYEWIVKMPIC